METMAVKLTIRINAYALTGLMFNSLTITQGDALCCWLMPLQGMDPVLRILSIAYGEPLTSVQGKNLYVRLSPERALALAQGIALGPSEGSNISPVRA